MTAKPYRVRPAGVGDGRGFFTGFRAGVGAACSSSGYFLVLGQISRHGCALRVAVASFTFWLLSFRSGPSWLRSSRIPFSLSEDSRKFWSVILMLSLLE